jgi:hypothetical protein
VPLTATLQLRPHLGYLDQLQVLEKQARAREKAGEDGSGGEESDEGGEGEENADGEKKPKKSAKKVKQEDGPKQARLFPASPSSLTIGADRSYDFCRWQSKLQITSLYKIVATGARALRCLLLCARQKPSLGSR